MHRDVHLGIAVDLDFKGLIAPVIRNADGKRLRLIAREIRDLATRGQERSSSGPTRSSAARSRSRTWARSAPTLTLPIINQPQVAILATDGIRKEPVVVEGPDGDDTIAIHHVGCLVARVGPPRVRRRVRRLVPQRDAHRARDARLGGRARVTTTVTAGAVARARFRTARPRRCSARCTSAPTDDYLLLLEHPHVYTLGSSADPAHVLRDPASVGAELVDGRSRRRRHLPRPGPARRLPDRLARRVARRPARRRRVRAPARRRADRGARRLRHRGDAVRAATPACGSATRRSRRSACGSRGAARATGSRSTSIPTSRCSTTSSRAASATAASRRWRACSAAPSRCARSSTASSRASPSRSDARRRAAGRRVASGADDRAVHDGGVPAFAGTAARPAGERRATRSTQRRADPSGCRCGPASTTATSS